MKKKTEEKPQLDEDALKRKVLFTPLRSKQALHDWIELFLGVDLPDCVVAKEGPNPSNSSPMDMIYGVYSACLENRTAEMPRVMAYASRDSFKTLGAAILEVLAVLHLDRDVGHMAAIQSQSDNAMKYVKGFFDRPYLRDFKVGDNVEKTTVVRFYHPETAASVSEKEWNGFPEGQKNEWRRVERFIKIVICTIKGANSLHVPFLVVDEVDIADVKAYKQARFIPSVFEGKEPITLLISTRKSGTGLVQRELDNAPKSGLKVWHWNVIDVTERCPTARHRPDLPKLPIYRSDDTMRALSPAEYDTLTEDEQEKYTRDEDCFNGCLTNCKLYAICRGQLATKQESTSSALRTLNNTQNRFIENTADSEDLVKAEMLCWAPSSEGLIYYRFNPQIHRLTPSQIAEKITGEPFPNQFTKQQLYALCMQREMQFFGGMDFGYTHNFVSVIGVRDGARMFILDCYSLGELDDPQKVDFCARRFKYLKPIIYGDPEAPNTIKTFKRNGFSMREWSKGKGSVQGGIEVVRSKLWPIMGREPQLYFISNDQGVDMLCERMSKYHWVVDKAGRLTDEPNDVDDDEMDALRYLVMNVFAPKGKLTVARDDEKPRMNVVDDRPKHSVQTWMREMINERMGVTEDDAPSNVPVKGKKNNFIWDL